MKSTIAAVTLGAIIATYAEGAVGSGYTLFGSASYVSPGNASNRAVRLVSDANTGTYSGIDYAVSANLTIDNLNTLSTDYNFTAGTCGVGSPRFGITLAGVTGTIFVYIGPYPNYTNCAPGWTNTGNLLSPSPTNFVDASQVGGSFYQTWASVQAHFSGTQVTDIFLVSDNGASSSQTVLIDNTNVNGMIYTYEPNSPDDCKNGGWQNFSFAPGPFKNQGQCVSYFEHQK